jgi:hypothetical protein
MPEWDSTQGAADPLVTQLWTAFQAAGEHAREPGAGGETVRAALEASLSEYAVPKDAAEYALTLLDADPNGPAAVIEAVLAGHSQLVYEVAGAYGQPAAVAQTHDQGQHAGAAEEENPYEGVRELFDEGPQIGDLDPTGSWQWNGTQWVAAPATAEAPAPATAEAPAAATAEAPAPATAEATAPATAEEPAAAATEQPQTLQVGDKDPSGSWEWNGAEWVAAGTAAAEPAAAPAAEPAAAAAPAAEAAADTAVQQIIMPALSQVLQDSPELAQLSTDQLNLLLAEVVSEALTAGSAA